MTPLMCMAVALFFEARSEDVYGMEAIGNVIINRVESDKFPDTVCAVVNQSKQFSYTHDGKSDDPLVYDSYHDKLAWVKAKEVASRVMGGDSEIAISSTFYHAEYVKPYWADHFTVEAKVGQHIFYME